jgi:hypothetical protein
MIHGDYSTYLTKLGKRKEKEKENSGTSNGYLLRFI